MEDFLLLGQVPGTDITINFGLWLTIALPIVSVTALWLYARRRRILQADEARLQTILAKRYQLQDQNLIAL